MTGKNNTPMGNKDTLDDSQDTQSNERLPRLVPSRARGLYFSIWTIGVARLDLLLGRFDSPTILGGCRVRSLRSGRRIRRGSRQVRTGRRWHGTGESASSRTLYRDILSQLAIIGGIVVFCWPGEEDFSSGRISEDLEYSAGDCGIANSEGVIVLF